MSARRGFTLVEVMVAVVMLAIVVVSVARGSTAISITGRTNDVKAKRTAALMLEANKFGAVPYATLATWPTTDLTVTNGDFTYTRKLTITSQNTSNTRYTIKIVVVPSIAPSVKDSVIFDRTLAPSTSPLCVGC